MIFQAWVATRCGGKPSEAVRRLEAAGDGNPVDRTRIYRALRRPTVLPARLAQLVVAASGGECSLLELVDIETIRLRFEYADPELRRRGIEYQALRATRRLDALVRQIDRLTVQCEAVKAELAGYETQLAAAVARAAG